MMRVYKVASGSMGGPAKAAQGERYQVEVEPWPDHAGDDDEHHEFCAKVSALPDPRDAMHHQTWLDLDFCEDGRTEVEAMRAAVALMRKYIEIDIADLRAELDRWTRFAEAIGGQQDLVAEEDEPA